MAEDLITDTEVYSETPIKKGTWAFLRDPHAELLLASWVLEENPDQVYQWAPFEGELPPKDIIFYLQSACTRKKWAFNAMFDFWAYKLLLPKLGFHFPMDIRDWRCDMVNALSKSLPSGLELLCHVLGLPLDKQKQAHGKKLIKLFCQPQVNKDGSTWRATPQSHPDEWRLFKEYNKQDSIAQCAVHRILQRWPCNEWEWDLWHRDQEKNAYGLPINTDMVVGALRIAHREKSRAFAKMKSITGLDNPNSITQLHEWLDDQHVYVPDMTKLSVADALAHPETPEYVQEVLLCRQEVAKTSTAKYAALVGTVCPDGRLRGAFQYRGAPRTGRASGRIFQPHNLPKGKLEIKELHEAVELIQQGDPQDVLGLYYGRPMDVLSSCIRAVVQAPAGQLLLVADLSAIENRVLGWLSCCSGILDVFRNGLDPYKDFGSRMFRKPYDQVTKKERNDSKPPVLGCGFMLSGGILRKDPRDGRMVKTGLWAYAEAMKIELTKEQAHTAVQVFREAFPEVVQFWWDVDNAFRHAIEHKTTVQVGYLTFRWEKPFVTIQLPSGRKLYYCSPKILYRIPPWELDKERPKPKLTITYNQMDPKTNQWMRVTTHPGKITENCVQAVANDILGEGLREADRLRQEDPDFEIVGDVHDEIIAVADADSPVTIDDLCKAMSKPVPWAPGLPLAANGFITTVYRKD
jgi:DNA polymerase